MTRPANAKCGMTNTVDSSEARDLAEEAKPSGSAFVGKSRKRSGFIRYFGVVTVLAAVLVASASFLILTGATDITPTPELWAGIWAANVILVLLVVSLVVTEIILLLRARRRQQAGARLQVRMVTLFAILAAVPAFLVAIVATISLNQGLDQWFSQRTRAIVESSRLVARSYMLEHAQVLRDDVIWVATELESARGTFETDRDRYQRILTALAVTRSLPFTTLISRDTDTLMRAQINVPGVAPKMPPDIMKDVKEGVPTLISPGSTNMVGATVQLRGYEDTFLFVARPVDPEVLEYLRLTDENLSEYRQYASNRLVFQITFTLMYVGLALVLLLAALWIGIAFANRFVAPIRNLMVASHRVSRGDLGVQVPIGEDEGDFHDLALGFNQMTEQLSEQRGALVLANETNEKRRQFTEAVVEGVSAGIIGLDPYGVVTLVNATACRMFDKNEVDLVGEKLADAVPLLEALMTRAQSTRRGQMYDQIQVGNEAASRTYQVRLTREGTMAESKGYVITLDDMTDLMTAQRTSAWADVARRIAHEIKNPLTPIQLSAERLRRRYADKLSDDFDVFDKCVATIIRQVGDIGRMVDEFSSFARMPTAALSSGDLSDTIRQSVFLEGVRQPEIALTTSLPDEPIYADFDDRLLSQALTNLVKNAMESIEFVGLDKIDKPEVSISAEIEGDFVRINVSDNGKGWPKEHRNRLLEPYMTTREKGTGLGLAIVAKIIEQHMGEVELLDAAPDAQGRVGACFSFRLPIYSVEDGATEQPEREDLEELLRTSVAAEL